VATIRSEITTLATADEVWSAVRDIGALHTRLVPGFVADTSLEPGARIVTFVNGVTLREPIVTLDDEARRLVWTAEGVRARHYNAALEVASIPGGATSVVWTADFLPDELHGYFLRAIEAGMAAMQRALDRLAAKRGRGRDWRRG
jgi:Polyketide cyclase / dehydrase and lipid transport